MHPMRDPLHPSPARTIHLADYCAPAWQIPEVELRFELDATDTLVHATLQLRRDDDPSANGHTLRLQGEELETLAIAIDGTPLPPQAWRIENNVLCLEGLPAQCELRTTVRIHPASNTQLMGLYASGNSEAPGLFTQCEAEGFRRITWFLDRPDVMSRYRVTLEAQRERFPVLLGNGNRVAEGSLPDGRHWARWEDPFPKPCYLFALVAGKLDLLQDHYTTASGRDVTLSIYVDPGKLDQCGFAMQALKKSMRWDEQVFGLELDLDGYIIVAVGDFNMGAMENKGLNIFNTKYVLARPDTATDIDYQNVDRVVAHEYFHNWTGNRVTCRDWFQLSLKEGLTVFRDQEFGADMYSRAVQRIQEVRGLRAAQFPEDAGPMAHPVRPQSYQEISNFYTATVYEKGAELVRMIHTLLGAAAFRQGMDLYFQRHDGQAVTTEDFVAAMADASGINLDQFRRWYDHAGTPQLQAEGSYDASAQRYRLRLSQQLPGSPGVTLQIPVAVGLVGAAGEELLPEGTRLLSLTEAEQVFEFDNVSQAPVLSILRDFSAPVLLQQTVSEAELTHLMAHDSDAFNRWEAGQRLASDILLRSAQALQAGQALPPLPAGFIAACAKVLAAADSDPAFAAEALSLPSESTLAERMQQVDPDALHAARCHLRRQLALALQPAWRDCLQRHASSGAYSPDAASAGRRALRNLALGYLMELDSAAGGNDAVALAMQQFEQADNMTDRMAALSCLANRDCPERLQALQAFYTQWQHEPLVVDKWLAVQATSRLPQTLAEVQRLCRHPAFDLRNPNKVYALIRSFCLGNHVRFHAADGSGYDFAVERIIELDRLNAQVAARVARSFDRWRRFDATRQAHAKAALQRIRDSGSLSRDVAEIIERALG